MLGSTQNMIEVFGMSMTGSGERCDFRSFSNSRHPNPQRVDRWCHAAIRRPDAENLRMDYFLVIFAFDPAAKNRQCLSRPKPEDLGPWACGGHALRAHGPWTWAQSIFQKYKNQIHSCTLNLKGLAVFPNIHSVLRIASQLIKKRSQAK